jgi:phosphocarrier protein
MWHPSSWLIDPRSHADHNNPEIPQTLTKARRSVSSKTVTICNKRGLHARAAARVAKLAEDYSADISVAANGLSVSALSIMGLMLLAAGPGTEVKIEATGQDAEEAISALIVLIESRFDEDI